jgi:hypothetical protein
MNRIRRASKLLRGRHTAPRAGHVAAKNAYDHMVVAGVRVTEADLEALIALLHGASEKQLADRLAAALNEGLKLNDLSIDERLAIQRALEECPGEMVDLRARLLSEPQPTWRQQRQPPEQACDEVRAGEKPTPR